MKKNIILSGVVALFVSLSTMGAFHYFSKNDKTIRIEHINSTPAAKAVFTIDNDGVCK